MSSLITDEIRSKAVIYQGKDICKAQQQRLLKEVGLPNGLLPIDEAYECGHIEETGFVWLKQKKKSDHKFEKIGRQVSYGTEVTAYADKTKIRKLTGVKAKEFMMWLTINEITVPSMDASEKITFKTSTGLFRTFPFDAFVVPDMEVKEDDNNVSKDEEEVKKEIKTNVEDVKKEIKTNIEAVKKENNGTNKYETVNGNGGGAAMKKVENVVALAAAATTAVKEV